MKTKTLRLLIGASLLAVFAIQILLAGCASPGPQADSGSAAKPASAQTADTGKGGAQLWSENCVRCHNIRSPGSYSGAQWDVAMLHMRVRANLTAEEHRKILQFLKSAN